MSSRNKCLKLGSCEVVSNDDLKLEMSNRKTYCFRDRFNADVGDCLLLFGADMLA